MYWRRIYETAVVCASVSVDASASKETRGCKRETVSQCEDDDEKGTKTPGRNKREDILDFGLCQNRMKKVREGVGSRGADRRGFIDACLRGVLEREPITGVRASAVYFPAREVQKSVI